MVCPNEFSMQLGKYAEVIGVKLNSVQIESYYEELSHLPNIVKVIKKAMSDRVYKNGDILRLPAIPELKEYYQQLDGVLFGGDDNSHYRIEGPRSPDEQTVANNHLMMYLVSHFKCCPDKVIDLIDSGELKADLSLISKNIIQSCFSKDKLDILKRQNILDNYGHIIKKSQRDKNV